MFDLVTANGVTLVQSTRWQNLPVRHAFTTRLGGVSPTPYSSLNMAFHVGDQSANVVENRARVCAALHIAPEALVAGEQVHGTQVHIVQAEDAGRGAGELETAVPGTDILVSAAPGLALISFYADCVPLLLCDPVRRVVACAHAGWRGTLAQVGAVAVGVMSAHFGCSPANVQVLMGPAIGPCCYVVSAQLAADFQKSFGADVALGRQLDLRLANRRSLEKCGVLSENILLAPWCTSCENELFFSHRASHGKTGRIAAVIGLA